MKDELGRLAVNFCKEFLETDKNNFSSTKVISLYGAERTILLNFQNYMQKYFYKKGIEKITFCINNKEGYSIDVGYFIKNNFPRQF